jgi:roadblock/LC7 domain-containing protein
MTTLQSLLDLPGAMAAFRASCGGELAESFIGDKGHLDEQVLDLVAHMCAANLSIAAMQSRGWEHMTGMRGFYPVQQFTLIGFDWSVMVSETADHQLLGVVMRNDAADFEAADRALHRSD